MQRINLINAEKSDVKYNIFHFPDGEVQISLEEFSHKEPIQVLARITNAEELFIISQLIDILNRHEVEYDICLTYLMGMRMDRVMDFNRPFTLKVIANILSEANSISILEAHSSVIAKFLNVRFYSYDWSFIYKDYAKNYQIVFPDAGAKARYGKNMEGDIITCSKTRDLKSGKILGIEIDNPEKLTGQPLLIIDDLCDGGGTFCGIANEFNKLGMDKSRLNIIVTHMVNPKGIENLSKNFNHVWFTNSYKDWSNLPDNVTMEKIK